MTHLHTNVFLFLLFSVLAFAPPMIWCSKGFNIKLIPRHSKDSPLYQANLTSDERFQQMMEVTNARIQRLGATRNSQIDTVQPVVLSTKELYHIVEMDIGTPARRFYLLLDTGADMSWVQAIDCNPCFPIKGGSYDYKHSTSFKFLDCNKPMCIHRSCQQENYCLYRAIYGSGASYGIIGSEMLTFNSDGGTGTEIVEMYMGFGTWNDVQFGPNDKTENRIAGLFGLGIGAYSFQTQADTSMDHSLGRFSHCLAPFQAAVSTVLKFGNNADIPSDAKDVQTTPFVQGYPGAALYYLNCTGISVAGSDIKLPPNTFTYDPHLKRGGMIIDTGSQITGIYPSAFKLLTEDLDDYFDKYKLKPWTGRESPYCYATPPNFYDFPIITFHFQDADFDLEPDNGFFIEEDHFCLAIAPFPDISILGAFAQTNYVVRYDTVDKKLSWYPQRCY